MARKLLLGSYVLQDPFAGLEYQDPATEKQAQEISQKILVRYSHDLSFSSLIPALATSYSMTFESLDVKTTTTAYLGPLKLVYKPFKINRWLHMFFPKMSNRVELGNLWLQMENVRFPPRIGGTVEDILGALPRAASFQMGIFLAQGAYGAIHKCTWSKQEFAIKLFSEEEHLQDEAVIHFTLDHPHVVKPHGYSISGSGSSSGNHSGAGLIMELMDGDLQTWIKNKVEKDPHHLPLEEKAAIDVMLQLATALMYMHAFGLIHRDVKPGNFLVRFNQTFPSGLEVKLGDFGTARSVDDGKLTARRGTHCYWAPEVLQGDEGSKCSYTDKADVYSFGMTFYAVLTGETPLDKYKELSPEKFLEKIRGGNWIIPGLKRAGKRPRLPSSVDSSLAKLIQQCWHEDPEERPPFDVICWALEIIQCKLLGTEISSALDRNPEVYPMKLDDPGSGPHDKVIPFSFTNQQNQRLLSF
ncbi:probable LIM domain-containing serine/threonine-protein kinase DDB_G0287001 [Selaginella moellendorffii]|uniref:probable LIM domain-containing serine/threonine-protein kinase DDB_G0287001 n=1 Tax=Selaginella moellendorffii TaxID=88036 RepID=UPI000D1CE81B|nr:probable LIM domain-containing serine/threonine-protein kinase DDB_G0287001 [Selaginella moellendorffii]|eukprot:XP_024533746.1 probable LIM domain-containing serine/threonine-protein kinase DDB_G0287001 [Selaginella moellendorffii]